MTLDLAGGELLDVGCHAGTIRARVVDRRGSPGKGAPVFFFFSNRLGCLGSLVVSVLFTLVLIGIFRLL